MQLPRIEPHLHRKARCMVRHRPRGRKQRTLSMPPAPLVEPLDHPAPRRVLAIVDHAQIKHRTLHHTTARSAPAFDNAPVTVLLAVLPSPCESQVHGRRFYAETKSRKEGRSSLHAFQPHRPLKRFRFFQQNSKIGGRIGKVGLIAWTVLATRRKPPIEIVSVSPPKQILNAATPWPVFYDHRVSVSVRSLAPDIVNSISKYLDHLQADNAARLRFKKCMPYYFPT